MSHHHFSSAYFGASHTSGHGSSSVETTDKRPLHQRVDLGAIRAWTMRNQKAMDEYHKRKNYLDHLEELRERVSDTH